MYSKKKKGKKTSKKKEGEPKKPGEEIKEVEESLFSDVEIPKKRTPNQEHEEEIGLIEKERSKKPVHRSFSVSESAPEPETRQIVIRFNPRILERIVYISIIVILLLLVSYFFSTTTGTMPVSDDMISSAVEQPSDVDDEPTPKKTVKKIKQEEPKKDDSSTEDKDKSAGELTSKEVENEVPLSGDVSISITGVQTQTTTYGGKVKSISFIVDNGDDPFIPKVKIYVYDGDSKTDRLQAPTIKVFSKLDSGKRLIADVKLSGALFTEEDIETEKTVLLKLFDEGEKSGYANDRLLAKVETTITIS